MGSILFRSREWMTFGCTVVSTGCAVVSTKQDGLSDLARVLEESSALQMIAIASAIWLLRLVTPYAMALGRLSALALGASAILVFHYVNEGCAFLAKHLRPPATVSPLVLTMPDLAEEQDIGPLSPVSAADPVYGIWSPWTSIDAPGKAIAA